MVRPSAGPHSDKQWYIRFPCICRMRTYPHPQALACTRKLQVGTFAVNCTHLLFVSRLSANTSAALFQRLSFNTIDTDRRMMLLHFELQSYSSRSRAKQMSLEIASKEIARQDYQN